MPVFCRTETKTTMDGEKLRFGNTGLVARKVYRNFELCLMLITAFVLGGLVASVVLTGAGAATGMLFTAGIAVSLGVVVVLAEKLDGSGY